MSFFAEVNTKEAPYFMHVYFSVNENQLEIITEDISIRGSIDKAKILVENEVE